MKIVPILGNMSGKLAGIVASSNRGGQYLRQFALPNQPMTGPQTAIRAAMVSSMAAYTNDLDDDQRANWATYALNNPKSINGGSRNIGAVGWYCAINSFRLYLGLDRLDDPPAINGPATLTPTTITIVGTDLNVVFNNSDLWATADGGALAVFVSRFVSLGRVSSRGVPLQLAGYIAGDTATPPTSPATIPMPFPVVADQRYFTAVRAVEATGRLSNKVEGFLLT